MKKILFLILLLSLILSVTLNGFAQTERYVRPIDEGGNDVSFKKFRDSLIKTVKVKNRRQLTSIMDKNIKLSFGGHSGLKGLQELWNFNTSKTKIWDELQIILENGGKFTGKGENRTFCAPYLFMTFPEDLDFFEYQAIFGSNVNLREKPNLWSKVVTQLSYNIVKADSENSVTSATDKYEYIWTKVKTLGGKEGYVSSKYVRSSIDYRACFQKIRGRWKMTAFISGD